MRILLSNDDGVHARGLWTLHDSLSEEGECLVVAPEVEQSAASHALTLRRPLRVHQIRENAFSVDGTPTDCVLLAVRGVPGVVEFRPDLIVSGINHGPNLGDDVTYSGTVAAAFEGHLLGIPSIAISLVQQKGKNYGAAAQVARSIIQQIASRSLPRSMLLSINVPDRPLEEIRGLRVTHLGKRIYEDVVVEARDPRGRPVYWIGGNPSWELDEHCDMSAVEAGFVSVTPLHLELTDRSMMEEMEVWDLSLPPRQT